MHPLTHIMHLLIHRQYWVENDSFIALCGKEIVIIGEVLTAQFFVPNACK